VCVCVCVPQDKKFVGKKLWSFDLIMQPVIWSHSVNSSTTREERTKNINSKLLSDFRNDTYFCLLQLLATFNCQLL